MPLFRENVKTREEGGLRWDYHSFKAREICTQVGGVARDVERKGEVQRRYSGQQCQNRRDIQTGEDYEFPLVLEEGHQ